MATGKQSQARAAGYFENVADATTACLFAMTQGNLLATSLSHLIVAAQTGVLTGIIGGIALLLIRVRKRWHLLANLAIATMIADYLIHSSASEGFQLEAVVTGITAAALSWVIGELLVFQKQLKLPGFRISAIFHRRAR